MFDGKRSAHATVSQNRPRTKLLASTGGRRYDNTKMDFTLRVTYCDSDDWIQRNKDRASPPDVWISAIRKYCHFQNNKLLSKRRYWVVTRIRDWKLEVCVRFPAGTWEIFLFKIALSTDLGLPSFLSNWCCGFKFHGNKADGDWISPIGFI